ncbi:MAG: methyltransferase domain-containing protein [Flavobacteriales bacterium]|nr:MAG: methyltransferase domain-containing protein [Flavobacteriales bacterium]
MSKDRLDRGFWEERYHAQETGWDLGAPSTPLKEYLDQLTDKALRILIPGGGRAYEAEYAHRLGFTHVFVIDLTDAPFKDLLQRCPDFPAQHLITGDFFAHEGQYDLILEQTFFCALDPALRGRYVEQMHRLLKPGGKLVGVLFHDALNDDRPPFGGFRDDYLPLFRKRFPEVRMDPCRNSIAPRAGRELWLCAVKAAPVDCALHDRLEEAATRRRTVRLALRDGTALEGIIADLFVRGGADWMRLADGRELPLGDVAALR